MVATKCCHLLSIIHELWWVFNCDTNVNHLQENQVSISRIRGLIKTAILSLYTVCGNEFELKLDPNSTLGIPIC
ncbi:MAG: hypothetical protein ACFC1C_02545 [Candidatus Malihini olakiniferum]